jgi:hypothetical protein
MFTGKVGTWNNKVRNHSGAAKLSKSGEKAVDPFNFLGYSYCRIIEFVRILCILSWDWIELVLVAKAGDDLHFSRSSNARIT